MTLLKSFTQMAVVVIFAIALVAFTLEGIVPAEVFTGFAGVAFTWVFKEVEKEKEISRLLKQLGVK